MPPLVIGCKSLPDGSYQVTLFWADGRVTTEIRNSRPESYTHAAHTHSLPGSSSTRPGD